MTKPSLTAQECIDFITHTVGGVTPAFALTCVREFGEYLSGMHEWSFLRRGPVSYPIRPPIPLTTAVVWTRSTKELSKVGAFGTYIHVPGDRVTVSAGTGIDHRRSRILSKTSADAIVIEDDLGANTTDAEIAIPIELIQLAADFDKLLAQDSQTVLELGTESDLLSMTPSASGTAGSHGHYHGMVMQQDATDGGAPVTVIAFQPPAAAGTQDVFTLFYQRTFPEIVDATSKIGVPHWMAPFFRRGCQAVALGYHEEDEATVEERLDALQGGRQFQNMLERDGMEQPSVGPLEGGYVGGGYWSDYDRFGISSATVTGP